MALLLIRVKKKVRILWSDYGFKKKYRKFAHFSVPFSSKQKSQFLDQPFANWTFEFYVFRVCECVFPIDEEIIAYYSTLEILQRLAENLMKNDKKIKKHWNDIRKQFVRATQCYSIHLFMHSFTQYNLN